MDTHIRYVIRCFVPEVGLRRIEGPSLIPCKGLPGIKTGTRKGEPRTGSAVIGLTANRGVSSGPETESASPAG